MARYSAEATESKRNANYQKWLKTAINQHMDKFDYSESGKYFESQKMPEILIKCSVHEIDFYATPFNHVRTLSGGCSKCDTEIASRRFLETESEKFKEWFEKNRSVLYELRSDFYGMTNDVEIYCKKHKSIKNAKPTVLMRSQYACNACQIDSRGKKLRLSVDSVDAEIRGCLPEHISFLGVHFDAIKKKTLISIKCEEHGLKELSLAYLRKSTYKCPECGRSECGYTSVRLKKLLEKNESGKPTFLGVMEVEVFGIRTLKVGVSTRSLEERYAWHLKYIYFSIQIPEVDAYIMENDIHRRFHNNHDTRIILQGMRNGARWAGDTECYWLDKKDEVLEYINEYLPKVKPRTSEQLKSYELYCIPDFYKRDRSRLKAELRTAANVIGLNPETNELVVEFESIAKAKASGYINVSEVISRKSKRQKCGGLRWFLKDGFDFNNIPPLIPKATGIPVYCIDLNEIFITTIAAQNDLRSRGISISASHITSVCKGSRLRAGGFSWKYVSDIDS